MRKNPWFRFYSEVVNDPKVQRLPPEAFKAWVNLLCLACEGDGWLPGAEDASFRLRLSIAAYDGFILLLKERGLIDEVDGRLTPHNWGDRQFKSDTSRDRVAAFRERQRSRHGNGEGGVSDNDTRNVAPEKSNVTGNVSVSGQETDTEKIPSTVLGSLRSPRTSEGRTPKVARIEAAREAKDAERRAKAIEAFEKEAVDPEDAAYYRRCKAVLGDRKGGLVGNKLLHAKGGNHALARAVIEQASTKADPAEYVWRIIQGRSAEQQADRDYWDPRL